MNLAFMTGIVVGGAFFGDNLSFISDTTILSLIHISRLADVSVGTVDRVLHGRTGVSEASRKRVEEILKQLDYQPNMYASALASCW